MRRKLRGSLQLFDGVVFLVGEDGFRFHDVPLFQVLGVIARRAEVQRVVESELFCGDGKVASATFENAWFVFSFREFVKKSGADERIVKSS